MNRRDWIAGCAGAAIGTSLHRVQPRPSWLAPADYTLRIAPLDLEIAPGHAVHTVAYNGTVPGPVLRVREGMPITVDVVNQTGMSETVHWHGLKIPSDVDGAVDEGTPPIAAHGTQRYTFTPRPAGTRWYHTHDFAGMHLDRSTYTGQFGFIMVEPANDPGRHDQEIFLALHDWNPYLTGGDDGFRSVAYTHASINDRALGSGEPIRVRDGQRVLMHVLNASAGLRHWLALPGHRFQVVALDGNPVPNAAAVDALRISPGERVDAIVTMDHPGVWILGETDDSFRHAGMGVVVEYAGQSGEAAWSTPPQAAWDYLAFADPHAPAPPAGDQVISIPLEFRSAFRGHGELEHWTINGYGYPDGPVIGLETGRRHRLKMINRSVEDHPMHLHRHTFEITRYAGRPTSGIMKDVVVVPALSTVEVDFTADNHGKTLFHCHLQDHMDAGFMALFDYR
jgi:FtsP/CotA-like multicopper oxidase with cupredoxin domain